MSECKTYDQIFESLTDQEKQLVRNIQDPMKRGRQVARFEMLRENGFAPIWSTEYPGNFFYVRCHCGKQYCRRSYAAQRRHARKHERGEI